MTPTEWKGESDKAHNRREREGYFKNYCRGIGIDIGCQNAPLQSPFCSRLDKWDLIFGNGDATFMEGVDAGSYSFVHASHVLEHLVDPHAALRRWWEIVVSNGFILINVPHRDLYEKRTRLPSKWNPDHKTFYLPSRSEPPDTKSLRDVIVEALPSGKILLLSIASEGWKSEGPSVHSVGEYSIEAVVQKT